MPSSEPRDAGPWIGASPFQNMTYDSGGQSRSRRSARLRGPAICHFGTRGPGMLPVWQARSRGRLDAAGPRFDRGRRSPRDPAAGRARPFRLAASIIRPGKAYRPRRPIRPTTHRADADPHPETPGVMRRWPGGNVRGKRAAIYGNMILERRAGDLFLQKTFLRRPGKCRARIKATDRKSAG